MLPNNLHIIYGSLHASVRGSAVQLAAESAWPEKPRMLVIGNFSETVCACPGVKERAVHNAFSLTMSVLSV